MTPRSAGFILSTLVSLLLLLDHVAEGGVVRVSSPLQSLTIPDRSIPTPRQLYLEKLKAGLQAETALRKQLHLANRTIVPKKPPLTQGVSSILSYLPFNMGKSTQVKFTPEDEELVEKAYDDAVARVEQMQKRRKYEPKIRSRYQFVGIVTPPASGQKKPVVKWYARRKPAHSKWTVRLVHPNHRHIIKDLFLRGKVDFFAKYKNKGIQGGEDKKSTKPLVMTEYEVRERSWKNLWNFSPKHFFTDSSGHFWRERRLPTGIYTDGVEVCEIVYNYPGGRNGIRPLCLLQDYMKRNATDVDSKEKVVVQLRKQNEDRNRKLLSADFLKLCGPANQKVNERIMKRLKEDAPDIVLEFDKSWIQLKTTSLRQA